MARFNRQFSLSVAKLDNNNIKFCYQKITAKSAVALGGTGQGLEDRCKIYSRDNIDYGTILPLEVNAIFVSNVFSLRSFSFDLAQQHLDALFTAFSPTVRGAGDANLEHIIENAARVREKKSGVSLLAEAKSEIRAQVGFMADPATFLVLPRVGLGVAGTLSIFDIQKNKQETRTFVDNKGVSEEYSSRQQAFFAASLYAYQESKIMPIEMASIPADSKQLYCFPLPLVEECRQNLPTTRHPLARHYRMDGAVLKLTGQPCYISGATELPAMKNETPLPAADGLDYGIDEIIGQLLEKLPLPLMDLVLATHERIKHAAANDIGYQILKPAANLSMFVVSRGDDKRGLLAVAQQGMPNIQRCRKENKVSFQSSLNRLLMPWKRDTTLGEYLAEKNLASRMNPQARRRTPANAFDFIQALERYVVRNTRHSLGKQAAITALATYKLQPGVLKRVADDFCSLLREIQDELSHGRRVDRYVAAVADIATVFNIQRPQGNPFLQLDSISLIKHHTLTRRVGTIPCTVLNVARKRELTYSTPLDAIRFEYRGMELFPCRMVSSLAIMPDLFQFNREYVP
ncbi:hypothetical protein ACL2XP_12630 [Sodalis sp. RH21]|uniref:hypothetical protein n=1 Tax=unclassified Sodalis (in: enterobacteria) TaxID=2636512 RepID=UPI0039B3C48A